MNAELEVRLEGLRDVIGVLADHAQKRRDFDAKKAQIAKDMIGLPYYWDKYSGFIKEAKKATEVEVHLTHQTTEDVAIWRLDAIHVYEHLLTIQDFSSWEAYYENQKLGFANSVEDLLLRWGLSQKEIEEKMTEYCSKYDIPYKSYRKVRK
ncbi:hypothetical protein [Paenibacillus polymyxa]|uniref:Uncharacterized protein n=1 Tax=Paenibacillus polymyxa (strain SC2) TaxID=886882 RepID=E3EJX4_PAEPS|nr:hypothetical protein [Paenibacillus polymyxa]ADO59993.1 hypothetical protein PPSC2_28220 [Paenibacillus polymyxa SC2]WPQ59790.1 hypothetical protein SKN87_26235 [Paenibacillus polymyxa]